MEYLLFLQRLRESAPAVINDGILFLFAALCSSGINSHTVANPAKACYDIQNAYPQSGGIGL